VLTGNQKAIINLSTGYMDSKLTTAFVTDSDNDLATYTDRDIYISRPGLAVQNLTNNQVLDSNPGFAVFNGKNTLFWYSEGNIKYASSLSSTPSNIFASPQPGLSDEFKIVTNSSGKTAVIWTKGENGATELYTSLYDSNKALWSEDVKISNSGAHVRFPSGIFDNEGNFIIAFNRTTISDWYEQSDLCITKVVPSYNIAVDKVLYDDTKVAPNSSLPIEIYLTNKGELGADSIKIEVLDGANVISSSTIAQNLKPGEAAVIKSSFKLPSTISKKNYTVKASIVNGSEQDLSENSKDITVGYTDLKLELEQYNTGGKQTVTARVYNASSVPSSATLKIRENSPEGSVVTTKTLDSIAPSESATTIFTIDPEELNYGDDAKALYFTIETSEEELRTGSNDSYIVIGKPQSTAEVSTTLIRSEQAGNNYNIQGNFKNNTAVSKDAKAIFALYGLGEQLLDLKIIDLNLSSNEEITLDQTLSTPEEVADTKIFVLEDLKSIKPLSNFSKVIETKETYKPNISIQGKTGAAGKYGSALLNDINAKVNGNGTIELTVNPTESPQQLTYAVLPYKADASDASDGYKTSEEVQASAVAFGIITTSTESSKTIALKPNTKSDKYIIKIGGGNGIDGVEEANIIRYVYVNKSFDVDNNSVIDIKDLASVAKTYNASSTKSLYNEYYDLNSDKIIDVFDLVTISNKIKY
jgi:hypothetical protein